MRHPSPPYLDPNLCFLAQSHSRYHGLTYHRLATLHELQQLQTQRQAIQYSNSKRYFDSTKASSTFDERNILHACSKAHQVAVVKARWVLRVLGRRCEKASNLWERFPQNQLGVGPLYSNGPASKVRSCSNRQGWERVAEQPQQLRLRQHTPTTQTQTLIRVFTSCGLSTFFEF